MLLAFFFLTFTMNNKILDADFERNKFHFCSPSFLKGNGNDMGREEEE